MYQDGKVLMWSLDVHLVKQKNNKKCYPPPRFLS